MGKNNLPILAVTMGDPAGIGPEIAVKVCSDIKVLRKCKPIIIGNVIVIEKAVKLLDNPCTIRNIGDIQEADFSNSAINVLHIEKDGVDQLRYGEISSVAGDLAFKSVKKAIELALAKKVDATVTGPIHKESINLAGHHFSGHTEIYAHYTKTQKYAMLLAHENFRVIHVTTHVSLKDACNLIKKERILEVIHLLNDGLKKLGIQKPVIGVAGLNPHSGDGGLFGKEEITEIAPAIFEAKNMGINTEGPIPPDTLFLLAYGGKYDACVAMYHDQGHIPFKLIGFKWDKKSDKMESVSGVNITLGLPIIRTSVDHGTAFEIAGHGKASPDALYHAIDYALNMAKN